MKRITKTKGTVIQPMRLPRRAVTLGLLGTALGASGCARMFPGRTPTLADDVTFRDERTKIGATTRFDPERFQGTYHLAAAMTETEQPPAPRQNSYYWTEEESQIGLRSVVGTDEANEVLELYDLAGPGRLVQPYVEGEEKEVWVLWTDLDYRTVVLASPNGSFAEIWDRSREPAPDRLAAAREILDFNGFDLNQLQSVQV